MTTGEFRVAPNEPARVNARLERLVDLEPEGWWSAGTHVHRAVEDIESLMRAEDLHIAEVITWWNEANPVGYNRAYVHVEGELTYPKWYAGLKAGRVFVSNGPLLRVQANGQWPGHVFRSDGPLRVQLDGRLDSRDPIATVELVRNGRVEIRSALTSGSALRSWRPSKRRSNSGGRLSLRPEHATSKARPVRSTHSTRFPGSAPPGRDRFHPVPNFRDEVERDPTSSSPKHEGRGDTTEMRFACP